MINIIEINLRVALFLSYSKNTYSTKNNVKQANCKYASFYAQKADLGILEKIYCR